MNKFIKLKNKFEELEDRENSIKMSTYMRNKFKFYGIPSKVRKECYKEILKQEKKSKVIDWNLLDDCYNDEHREFQYFVLDYLITMGRYLEYNDIEKIKRYVNLKQWWDTIDFFDRIIGNIGLIDDRVDSLMLDWSKDEDIWLRRLAIDHQLGRKEKTNCELLEKIIVNNLGTKEFFINKAIGWSLRDYSKVNPKWVEDFINKYKNKMDNLSIKEAIKYIN